MTQCQRPFRRRRRAGPGVIPAATRRPGCDHTLARRIENVPGVRIQHSRLRPGREGYAHPAYIARRPQQRESQRERVRGAHRVTGAGWRAACLLWWIPTREWRSQEEQDDEAAGRIHHYRAAVRVLRALAPNRAGVWKGLGGLPPPGVLGPPRSGHRGRCVLAGDRRLCDLKAKIPRVAASPFPVVIEGETGT